MSIYTDLALEARELDPELDGVTEQREREGDIEITRIGIVSERAAKALNKKTGSYITIDAPRLIERSPELFRSVAKTLSKEITGMLKGVNENAEIVVVGLGNRNVTPDSLGPRTVERVFVTRHINRYLPDAFEHSIRSVAAIAPGVLGSTGVETVELIKGVCEKTRPDLVIAVDSLASRRAARISTTVQLTDAGIEPGSGVGNLRSGVDRESLGVPVLAIGVPLVVCASTITQDAISMIADQTGLHDDEERLRSLAEKVAEERMDGLIVTPKDIDRIVSEMSEVLAEGINRALFSDQADELKNLMQ